jgi:hypothetical protein
VSADKLSPWRLTWVWDAVLGIFAVFSIGSAVSLIMSLRTLNAHFISRALMLILVLSGVAFVLTLMMWSRHWRRVRWDVGFWSFISGPEPESEDPRLAWRWGRRCRVLWVVMVICVFGIPALEAVLGK